MRPPRNRSDQQRQAAELTVGSQHVGVRQATLTVGARRVLVRQAELSEIIALRHAELRPERPRSSAEFAGDTETTTRHFGAFLAGTSESVGCASFMLQPYEGEPAWQLRGMATRADLVHRGIGTALLRLAEVVLRNEMGARVLWCNARVGAAGFYRSRGWQLVSNAFEIPDVGPHHRMLRRLPATST
jgi:GNAT superfamily N-acetyltransferase